MPSCARCAATANLEIHHVVPRCHRGENGATQVLCHDCHVRLHAEAGHYAAWGRAGAQAVMALYGAEGRAFLQEIGARGSHTVLERYGSEYLRELGRRGGQTTAGKNGHLRCFAPAPCRSRHCSGRYYRRTGLATEWPADPRSPTVENGWRI